MTLEKPSQAAKLPFVILNAFLPCAIDHRSNIAFSGTCDLRPSLTRPAAFSIAVVFPILIARSSGADPSPVGQGAVRSRIGFWGAAPNRGKRV